MDMNSAFPSKYLKKEDFPQPTVMVIETVKSENVAPDNQAPEQKPVIYFRNESRGLVLNRTNTQILIALYGAQSDAYAGKQIVVFNDPTIQYAGRTTGGLRFQAPRQDPNQLAQEAGQDNVPY